jgi:hypothetical protein
MEQTHLPAKTCYSHLGGKLGAMLFTLFVKKKWISPSGKHFYITEKGKKEFTKLGIDLSRIKEETL